jgi:ABC-type Fe3+/spermidine/putrescine transport system ATPase subunit
VTVPAVELRALWKEFDGVAAVRGVALAVSEGEFVALLGPSGCGKTTTLRMIAGFEIPTRGDILIRGRTVSGPGQFAPPERRDAGLVFQNYAVWPHMTVEANVGYPLKVRGVGAAERRSRVLQMLELVQLSGLGDRYPHQLSGGQQQRVALARALSKEPAVLLLDEPLSNLDARLRKEMRIEIKTLQRRLGITIVYVTHDQEEALSMADRIAVMGQGVVHQLGTPEEVFEQPADRFVAEFMGCTTFLPCEVAGPNRVRLLLGAEMPCVSCPLAPGAAGRGVVGLRAQDVRLASDGADTLAGHAELRTYRGGSFEVLVGIGGHAIPVITDTPLAEGSAVRLALTRLHFFPETRDATMSGRANKALLASTSPSAALDTSTADDG